MLSLQKRRTLTYVLSSRYNEFQVSNDHRLRHEFTRVPNPVYCSCFGVSESIKFRYASPFRHSQQYLSILPQLLYQFPYPTYLIPLPEQDQRSLPNVVRYLGTNSREDPTHSLSLLPLSITLAPSDLPRLLAQSQSEH